MKKRDPVIDSLKGFAILCVVMGHVISTYQMEKYMEIPILYGIYNIIYAFHMPLFFLMSGFLYHAVYFDRDGVPDSKRLNAQIWNLICLYFIYNSLAVFSTMLFASVSNQPATILDFFLSPFIPFQVHWYLYVLILFYLFFRPLMRCKAFNLVGGGVLIINILSAWLPACPWFSLNQVLYNLFFFWLGTRYFIQPEIRKYTESKTGIAVMTIACAVLFPLFWNMERRYLDTPIVNFVLSLSVSLLLWIAFQKIHWLGENKYLRYLGQHSLEIYLLHRYFYIILKIIMRKLGFTNPYGNVALGSVIGVVGPLIIIWLLENVKIFKKLDLYEILFRPYYFVIRKTGDIKK